GGRTWGAGRGWWSSTATSRRCGRFATSARAGTTCPRSAMATPAFASASARASGASSPSCRADGSVQDSLDLGRPQLAHRAPPRKPRIDPVEEADLLLPEAPAQKHLVASAVRVPVDEADVDVLDDAAELEDAVHVGAQHLGHAFEERAIVDHVGGRAWDRRLELLTDGRKPPRV